MKNKKFTFFAVFVALGLFITILIALRMQMDTPNNLPKKDNNTQIAEETSNKTDTSEATISNDESNSETTSIVADETTQTEENADTTLLEEADSEAEENTTLEETTAIPQIEPAAPTKNPESESKSEVIENETTAVKHSFNSNTYNQELYQAAKDFYQQNYDSYQEVLKNVNALRAEVGVSPLILDDNLCINAAMRAFEIAYYQFSHTRPSGKNYYSVLDFTKTYYRSTGENIAAGHTDADAVVAAWKASPEHYQNMVNSAFQKLGVGIIYDDNLTYDYYWVQLFTN